MGAVAGMLFSGDGAEKDLRRNRALWRELEQYLPQYDMRSLDAPELTSTGTADTFGYSPVIRQEAALPEDNAQSRSMQARALQEMLAVAENGMPVQDRIAAQNAQQAMAAQNQRLQNSVIQNMQERGLGSGGDELAARMIGNQQSADMARGMGSDLASQALQRRLAAISGAGQQASSLRGMDFGVSSGRADAMNRFNEWASSLGTQAAQYNAAAGERAQQYNLGNSQRISDTNQMSRYATDQSNLNRQNSLRGQTFQDRVQQTSGLSGAHTQMANWRAAEQAGRERMFQDIGAGVGNLGGGGGEGGGGGGGGLLGLFL